MDAASSIMDAYKQGETWSGVSGYETGSAIGGALKTMAGWFESFVDKGKEWYVSGGEAIADFVTGNYDKAYDYYPINRDRLDAYVQSMIDLGRKHMTGADGEVEDDTESLFVKLKKLIDGIDIDMPGPVGDLIEAFMVLPSLLLGFRDELSKWFEFDIEAFITKLNEYSERMKAEGEPIPTEEGD